MAQTPNNTYYSPSNAAVSESFDIEFNDSILDTRFWKSRSEGSQLRGSRLNVFTEGDASYGKNPVVENKVSALYIGSTIIGGDAEDPSRVEIQGHSYVTIDKILIIDIETDDIQIVDRQSLIDINTGTVNEELAFKRYVTRDFKEGSEVNLKLIDRTVQNSLKPSHFVKFNRGSLMRIYSYTANQDGFEDGVFGGHDVRLNKGNSHTGSLAGPGLFGFGMTAAASRSLFNLSSIDFVGSLPSELNDYIGDVDTATLGTELAALTASAGSSFLGAQLADDVALPDDNFTFGSAKFACLVAGMRVLLSNGSWKEIENIQIGELVKTKEGTVVPVLDSFILNINDTMKIYSKGKLKIADTHPVWVNDKWQTADQLNWEYESIHVDNLYYLQTENNYIVEGIPVTGIISPDHKGISIKNKQK